jgi:aspartyl-tRNA(Asn)/glutamyl-tRNA(Gln) amidotransferase subunit C
MTRIGREEVERIAHLARLRLDASEAEGLARDLDAILGYVEQLAALDTEGVEAMSHVAPLAAPMREDATRPSLRPEEVVRNAPAVVESAFAVPKVLGSEEEG